MSWATAFTESGRHRTVTLSLSGRRSVTDRTRPERRFIPATAVIRLESDSDDAPHTRFTISLNAPDRLPGTPKAVWDNTSPDPAACIRSAPAWVREMFAEATGHGYLVNTYEGPAWAYESIELLYPLDPAYPRPGSLEAAA